MGSTWTLEDLAAIEAAIASGALEVEYNDRRVKFRSIKDLREARQMIMECLGLVKRGARILCKSSKGTS